jgi:hypothetical protein
MTRPLGKSVVARVLVVSFTVVNVSYVTIRWLLTGKRPSIELLSDPEFVVQVQITAAVFVLVGLGFVAYSAIRLLDHYDLFTDGRPGRNLDWFLGGTLLTLFGVSVAGAVVLLR